MNLKDMKVAELRELAKENGLSCYNKELKKAMTKAELVEMLEAHFVATTAPEVETVTLEQAETAPETVVIVNNTDVSAMVTEFLALEAKQIELAAEGIDDAAQIANNKKWAIKKLAREYGVEKEFIEQLKIARGNPTLELVKRVNKHFENDRHHDFTLYTQADRYEAHILEILSALTPANIEVTYTQQALQPKDAYTEVRGIAITCKRVANDLTVLKQMQAEYLIERNIAPEVKDAVMQRLGELV